MSELDFMEKAESHEEKIICPNCGSVETATVKHTVPWWMYAHICSKCEYYITESEWQPYKEPKFIRFDNNYPKLHNQTEARLLMVIQDISGEMLLNNFPDLTSWDSLRDDGRYYNIALEKDYMLLLFVGDKNIMFPTLRKQNEENAILYAESVGDVFRIAIEPKGVQNGREQRNKG